MRIRRALVCSATAALLVLTPTVAMAYGAADFSNRGTLSTTTPRLGAPFTFTLRGPHGAGVVLTITSNPPSISASAINIAGTKALAKTTSTTTGEAVFTITLDAAGDYTLVLTDQASGEVISSQSVTVRAPGDTGTGTGGELGATGADAAPIAIGAGVLVALGAGAAFVARRRRSSAPNR